MCEATRMGSTRTNLQTKPVRRRQAEMSEVEQQLVEEIEDIEEFNAEMADMFDDHDDGTDLYYPTSYEDRFLFGEWEELWDDRNDGLFGR